MLRTLLLTFILFNCSTLFSQEGTLMGKVRDDKGEPIIGASVIYRKDITVGAITNLDGNYSLTIPVGESKIICRYCLQGILNI